MDLLYHEFDIEYLITENDTELLESVLTDLKEDFSVILSRFEGTNLIFNLERTLLEILIKHGKSSIPDLINSAKFSISLDNFDKTMENLEILFESDFQHDLLDFFDRQNTKTPILYDLIYTLNLPHDLTYKFTLLLLSYGFEISDTDVELIYDRFGHNYFFKTLLMMDIKLKSRKRDALPSFIYDINSNLEHLLRNPQNYDKYSLDALLNYYADPKLLAFCSEFHYIPAIFEKVKRLPTVPHLQQLARDQFRRYVMTKFKVQSSAMFYTVLQRLPIGDAFRKIVALESPIYF